MFPNPNKMSLLSSGDEIFGEQAGQNTRKILIKKIENETQKIR